MMNKRSIEKTSDSSRGTAGRKNNILSSVSSSCDGEGERKNQHISTGDVDM